MCGAEYPLKVAAFGENISSFGFADESLRPPGNIGNQPRWPITRAPAAAPSQGNYQGNYQGSYSGNNSGGYQAPAPRPPNYAAPSNGRPISLAAPGVGTPQDDVDLPPDGTPASRDGGYVAAPSYPPRDRYTPPSSAPYSQPSYSSPSTPPPAAPRLGTAPGNSVGALGQVSMKPAATLACPIVSALDRWLTDSVQPAAMQAGSAHAVVEIKQISAYSCRGMNGNPNAHISEHAFGNALDIAAFTLADGRRITVKDGWHGMPEEQGFLRDVQGAACRAVQHRAGAGLQRPPLRSHSRRPDAPRERAASSASPPPCRANRSPRAPTSATPTRHAIPIRRDRSAPRSRCRAGLGVTARSTRKTSSRIIEIRRLATFLATVR